MLKKLFCLVLVAFATFSCKFTPSFTATPIKLTGEERSASACRFIGFGNETIYRAAKKGNIKNIKIINQAYYPFFSCTEVIGD